MSGSEIAAEVSLAIAEAGAEIGDGTPLSGTILRTTGADESTYPPTPGTTQEYTCKMILTDYSARDRDGTNITDRDVKAMIAADAETAPQNGDRLRVSGRTYSFVNVMPYQPGGTVLFYNAQVRAGE
jgi:hypothetical protein